MSRLTNGERLRLSVLAPEHISFTKMIGFDHFPYTGLRVDLVGEVKTPTPVPKFSPL